MELLRNPPDVAKIYLDALNTSFGHWGDERTFEWAFNRQVSGPKSDLMILRDGGELMAGSAVSYRSILTPGGTRSLVGIMTGSWTLPAARGRGAFTRIIEESVALTREHGGALLLAFVTETNASYRRLEAAGSRLFPTRYISSALAPATAEPFDIQEIPLNGARAWFETFRDARPTGTHFTYADADEWLGQLALRPGKTSLLEAPGVGAALVESAGDFDRLQALCGNREQLVERFLARARSIGRRLFLFQSNGQSAPNGMTAAPGFLTALVADPSGAALLPTIHDWSLDSGDRM